MKVVLKVEDLKTDIEYVVSFEELDDMFYFFSKYHPNTFHVEHLSIYEND